MIYNMSILKKKINYTVACINEFANRLNITSKEAFDYLYENAGITFLKENYDIEHTLSFDDAVDDLMLICRKNGGSYNFGKKGCSKEIIKVNQMMEYMIQDLVEIITEEQGIDYDVALAELFKSQIYDKIMDEETGLYRESPSYVYGLYQDELNFGRIIQAEI